MGGVSCRDSHLSERSLSESGREGASSEKRQGTQMVVRSSLQLSGLLNRAESKLNKLKPGLWERKVNTEAADTYSSQRPCCSFSWLVRTFRISVNQATLTSRVGACKRDMHTTVDNTRQMCEWAVGGENVQKNKQTKNKYLNDVDDFSATVPDFKFPHVSFHIFCESYCTHLQTKRSVITACTIFIINCRPGSITRIQYKQKAASEATRCQNIISFIEGAFIFGLRWTSDLLVVTLRQDLKL